MDKRVLNRLTLMVLAIAAALALAGCGGGGGGTSIAPSPGVTLTVLADAAVPTQSEVALRAGTTVTAKLDAGATIDVYNFVTGEKIASGTIGSDGSGTVKVTAGLTVAIVVTGQREGKNYRLSLIIPTVPTTDTTVTADPATTIASEAIAAVYFKKVTVIDQDTFDAVESQARAFLLNNPGSDVSLGGGLISGTAFGVPGNLDSSKLQDVIAAVPAVINSAIAKAKNAVQQMKEAGIPMQSIIAQEKPALETIYAACAQALKDAKFDQVAAKYEELGGRLSMLLIPAIEGHMQHAGQLENVSVFELTVGKGYRATQDPWQPFNWLNIEDYPAYDTPGKITIKLDTSEGTYTLVASQTGLQWDLTQTSSADSKMEYKVSLPITAASDLGANPTLTGSFSVKDKDMTTPVTFSGTLSAVGPDQAHYTKITFNGTLASANVNAAGSFVVNYPATPPTGTLPEGGIYALPTSYSASGGSITVTDGTTTAKVSGDFSVVNEFRTVNGTVRALPTNVTLSNGRIACTSGNKSAEVKGSMSAKVHYYIPGGNLHVYPTEVKLSDGSISASDGSSVAKVTGNLTGTAVIQTVGTTEELLPNYVKLQGTYSDSATGMEATGTVEAKWNNPSATENGSTANGWVTVKADVKRKDRQDYAVDMVFQLNSGTASCTINRIGWGAFYMVGSASATVMANGELTNQSLTLTNQDGVKFKVGNRLVGEVTVGTEKVATTSTENGMMKITFTDGTHEYLTI